MRKYFAEFIGTFVLVFVGTGTVAIANTGSNAVGFIGIALAFGLAVTIMAYAVGGISGGHFNPAVSLAMMINQRLDIKDGLFYIVSQFLGATVASFVVKDFASSLKLPSTSLGQTDFPNISAGQAFLVEALITFLFIFVILMVTSDKFGTPTLAPLAIGVTLALLIMVTLNLTGGSLNPARSFGPAILAGGSALSHYWVYFLAPLVGGVIAAFVGQFMGSEE